jgi:hypothetical protein
MTQSTFTFKQSTTIGIWPVPESNNVWSLLPDFGDRIPATFVEIRSTQIPATKMVGFQPSGGDLAQTA